MEAKYRHEWVGKMTHWGLCETLKFDHTDKWFMQKQESVTENKLHEILEDIKLKMNETIQAKRPDLVLIKKKDK